MTDKPKILIVRMSSMGDIVLTSAVCRNIKSHWKNAHITFLTKKKFAHLASQIKYADEVMVYKNLSSCINEIRRQKFTHYLDLHSNFKSITLGLFSKIKNKTKYKKDSITRRIFVKFKIITPALQRHTLTRYLQTLEKWTIPVKYTEPSLEDWSYKSVKPAKDTKKIAILQSAFLGDAALTVLLVKKTAEVFKNAEIAVITRPEAAEIFKHIPCVSKVIVDDKKNTPRIKSFKALVCNLKSENFGVVLIVHRSLRSALAAFLAKIPVRVGFDTSAGAIFLTEKIPFSWLLHDAERNLSLLKPFEKDFSLKQPAEIKSDISSEDYIRHILKDNNLLNTPLAGIHAGSLWFTKRWLPENYAAVIKRLNDELKIKSILIGTENDFELAEKIIRLSKDATPLNLTGKTNISHLMALMEHLKLFITNDSGPMHIATAFNVATVAIFGPTTRELGFFPYSKKAVVIEKKLKCRPCSLHGSAKCPRRHFLCMRLITPKEVFKACKKQYENYKS
jgi:heptosyltransferase-2